VSAALGPALGGLALAAALACASPEALGPGAGPPAGGGGTPGTVGGGAGGGSTDRSPLVGSWRNEIVVRIDGDVQRWTTTWDFAAGGDCRKTAVTLSLVEGFPRTTVRDCRWTFDGRSIVLEFVDGGRSTFAVSFAGFDPNRLLLDDLEFARVG
jgi:hypothetical protein